MSEISRSGLDTSKAGFTVPAVDAERPPVLRVNLRRTPVIGCFRKRAAPGVAMEACGGSHHGARKLSALGHDVRRIPPPSVKPSLKRGKNERADAEAICAAAGRPGMRFVLATTEDRQAPALVLKVRARLADRRPHLINARRGHATAFGVVAGQGSGKVAALLAAIEAEAAIPAVGKEMLALLGEPIEHRDGRIQALEAKVNAMPKSNAISQRLATAPGIGAIIALTFARDGDPPAFESGRHLAAWLGLTPKEPSTGGKQRMGGISRAGNERLRALPVGGAMAVIRAAERPGRTLASEWLRRLLAGKPRKLAAVALADKMARMIWAMMRTGEAYRRPAAAGAARRPAVIS